MSTIIRASDGQRGIQMTAFNFDDMTAQANQCLDKVRAEAAKIIAQAQKDAAAIRQRAEAEGRQAAVQSVEKVVAGQLGGAQAALRQAVQEILQAKQAWLRHWEASAIHVAAQIAARVLRRELGRQPEVTLNYVREALQLASGETHVRIHLHPADHEAIARQVEALVKEMATLTTAEIVADATVTAGGCRVETRFGMIDQQIETQLQRIEEELT